MRYVGIVAVVCAALLAAGCGDKGKDGGGAAPGASGGSVVGAWGLDMAVVKPAMEKAAMAGLEAMRSQVPADQFEQMKKEALEGMMSEFEGAAEGRMVLKEGGILESYEKAGGPVSSHGTWTLDGTTLTLTETDRDGKALESPKVTTAKFEGGVIKMSPEGGMGFELVFQRK